MKATGRTENERISEMLANDSQTYLSESRTVPGFSDGICYKCQQKGHKALHCPLNPPKNPGKGIPRDFPSYTVQASSDTKETMLMKANE